jgi:uncharacterized membrane protein (UPF0127 family)
MIVNITRKSTLASHVDIAQNPWKRMKGLLGTSELPSGRALVITHCQSIHMFFMKFAIDVIFCDQQDRVVGLCANIKPFSLSPIFFKASYAIELPAGTISSSGTQLGDQIDPPL